LQLFSAISILISLAGGLMVEVFISYKSERRPAAKHLTRILAAYGFDVWFDYGLIPGENFEQKLLEKVGAAQACVVLWCRKSVASPWVLREADIAKGKGTLIPTIIERTAQPDRFGTVHTLDLSQWNGDPQSSELNSLLIAIGKRVGRSPQSSLEELADISEQWKTFGRPSLARFALEKPLPAHEPRSWAIYLHDDPNAYAYAVVEALERTFRLSREESMAVMQRVHSSGQPELVGEAPAERDAEMLAQQANSHVLDAEIRSNLKKPHPSVFRVVPII
jgi:ATP-dependent Clp protease adapter protein ClpS